MKGTIRSRRAAAVLALACLLGLAVALVVILWNQRSSLVIGLVGLALTAAGGWWVISQRMPRRALGAIGAVIGLGVILLGFINAVLNAEQVVIRMLAVAALAVIAIAAARYALRSDPDDHVDLTSENSRPDGCRAIRC